MQHRFQYRNQIMLANRLHAAHHFPLRYRVHRVDMEQVRFAILMTLVHRVHAQIAGRAFRIRQAPFRNGDLPALGVMHVRSNSAVRCGLAQILNMRNRGLCQPFKPLVAIVLPGTLAQVPHPRTGGLLMDLIHFGQCLDIGFGVPPENAAAVRVFFRSSFLPSSAGSGASAGFG